MGNINISSCLFHIFEISTFVSDATASKFGAEKIEFYKKIYETMFNDYYLE